MASSTALAVEPFVIEVGEEELVELRRRLAQTRWPDRQTVADGAQGVPLEYLQTLIEYWRNGYDWRARERRLNAWPQFKARVGELAIHFYHIRSPHPDAAPLLMTHGWPGSVAEFIEVFAPLTDPLRHGGRAEDAFHVVCPSLPGYGFSDKPAAPGFGVERIAETWDQLMRGLGYPRYVAQGGDWGAAVTTALALQNKGACRAIHLNFPIVSVPKDAAAPADPEEQRARRVRARMLGEESGYSAQQSTRPQTLAYALTDSPTGQCAWIIEKFFAWSDCEPYASGTWSADQLLDAVMLYWLPRCAGSAARLYWESFRSAIGGGRDPVPLPTGVSLFPKELSQPLRQWVEQRYPDLVYWSRPARGGHFAAMEQPELFVQELRAWLRALTLQGRVSFSN